MPRRHFMGVEHGHPAFFQSRDSFDHMMTLRFYVKCRDLSIPFSVVFLPRCKLIKKGSPMEPIFTYRGYHSDFRPPRASAASTP